MLLIKRVTVEVPIAAIDFYSSGVTDGYMFNRQKGTWEKIV